MNGNWKRRTAGSGVMRPKGINMKKDRDDGALATRALMSAGSSRRCASASCRRASAATSSSRRSGTSARRFWATGYAARETDDAKSRTYDRGYEAGFMDNTRHRDMNGDPLPPGQSNRLIADPDGMSDYARGYEAGRLDAKRLADAQGMLPFEGGGGART